MEAYFKLYSGIKFKTASQNVEVKLKTLDIL